MVWHYALDSSVGYGVDGEELSCVNFQRPFLALCKELIQHTSFLSVACYDVSGYETHFFGVDRFDECSTVVRTIFV